MSKKPIKEPIKRYNEHLTPEQHKAKALIDSRVLTVINGEAGTGKTHLAVNYALEQLQMARYKQTDFKKIVITRATVMLKSHNNGFLPGDIAEKFEPWLQPIYDNVLEFVSKEDFDTMCKNKVIEIVPLAYVQGRTFIDSIIIVDEAENLSDQEVEMLFTRIGRRSKMIFCGDLRQKIISNSGITKLALIASNSQNCGTCTLTENFRDPVVKELLDAYTSEMYSKQTNCNMIFGRNKLRSAQIEAANANETVESLKVRVQELEELTIAQAATIDSLMLESSDKQEPDTDIEVTPKKSGNQTSKNGKKNGKLGPTEGESTPTSGVTTHQQV